MAIQTNIDVRSGTSTEWADADGSDGALAPTLGNGELGVDVTKREVKVGDGTTAFATLAALKPVRVTTLTALVAGSKVVADTTVTANSVIIPVLKTLGTITAPKAVAITARSAGVSYTVTSADATDTSIYQIVILEP